MPRNPRINHITATGPAQRRTAPFSLAVGLCGLLAAHGAGGETAPWDCRMAPDGRGWQCLKDGQPFTEPLPPGDADIKPAPEAPGPGTPAPPESEPAARPTAAAATPEKAAPATLSAPKAAAAMHPTVPTATTDKTTPAPAPSLPDEPAVEHRKPATTPPPAMPAAAPAPSSATPAAAAPGLRPFRQGGEMPDLTAPTVKAAPTPVPPPQQTPDSAEPSTTPAPETAGVAAATRLDETTGTAATGAARDIDQGIDWLDCRIATAGQRSALQSRSPDEGDAPIDITADTAVAEFDPQRARFSGDVRLSHGVTQLEAQRLTLDRASGEVHAEGGLLLTRPEIRFAGSSADYRIATGEAQIEQASYRVPPIRARGDAERAAFLGNGISRFDNISYTTCAPGDASWLLSAEALELDQNEGFGTARNATLRFMGVPLLYAPSFTFPIDDRRRSGVLVPSVGYSDNTGADLSVPYYFNLAENYDLTLTPRLMSKRGLMVGGEFRFLTESTSGTLAADLLPDDRERDTGSSTRGAASLYSHTQFNPRTEAALRLNYVSDADYFEELGGSLAATSATHVERTGEVKYHADTWDLLGRVQYFQTIDDTIAFSDRPYSRLPQLRLALEQPEGPGGASYHLDAEYANFHRSQSVRGHRIDLAPAVSMPFGEAWWFVEPRVGAHYTAYDLTDQAAGLDATPSHLTALLSLDSGLYFDRGTSYFGRAATQTLEPRVFYLFVPASSQNDQPLFDTTALDFNFDNLFRDNRFNGPDRVGDANQVTLALTSRVNDQRDGTELLRASIGQIVYFEDRTVTLPGEPRGNDTTSALVGELGARLGAGWYTRAGLQWDPHDGNDGTIEQALAQVSYRDERRRVFNAAYRLREGVAQQTDLALFWPVSERFALVGRHNYSLHDSHLLEALAGVEYGSCCWRIRALARQYTDSSGDDHNLAFMIQLELNGLGRLGDDIDSTLERGIYGYRIDEDD